MFDFHQKILSLSLIPRHAIRVLVTLIRSGQVTRRDFDSEASVVRAALACDAAEVVIWLADRAREWPGLGWHQRAARTKFQDVPPDLRALAVERAERVGMRDPKPGPVRALIQTELAYRQGLLDRVEAVEAALAGGPPPVAGVLAASVAAGRSFDAKGVAA